MLSQKPFQVFDVTDYGEEFREVFGDKSVVFQAAERFEQTVPATAGVLKHDGHAADADGGGGEGGEEFVERADAAGQHHEGIALAHHDGLAVV